MKPLSTKTCLFFLFIFLGVQTHTSAQAIRNVDISPTLLAPQPGTNVPAGTPMQLIVSYKNMGPDTLQVTDTIPVAVFVDNFLVQGTSGTGAVDSFMSRETNNFVLPGDSFIVTYPSIIQVNIPNGNHRFCVQTYARGADLQDPVSSNNRACATFSASPSGVEDFSGEGFSFYPQPANNLLSWKTPSGQAVLAIAIYDLMGRQVTNQNPLPSENGLSISHLPDGFYGVQVRFSNGAVYQQKIQVLHR